MSSRKRSRADDDTGEEEAGTGRHAPPSSKRRTIDGGAGTTKMRPSNGVGAAAATITTTTPFTGTLPKANKKISAEERRRLASASLAEQQKTMAWKGGSEPTATSKTAAAVKTSASASARKAAAVTASAATAAPVASPYRAPARPQAASPPKPYVHQKVVAAPTRAAVAAAPPKVAAPTAAVVAAAAPSSTSRRSPAPQWSPPPKPPVAAAVSAQRPPPAPASSSVHHDGQLRNEGGDVFHVEAPKVVGSTLRWTARIAVVLSGVALLWTGLRLGESQVSSFPAVDLAPAAIGSLILKRPPPCFDSTDGAIDGSAASQGVVDHCAKPGTEFLPCPPHSICEAGQITACENRWWVLPTPEGLPVPTSCVPSTEALSAISRVTERLEAWSWPASCEGRPDDAPTPPPDARKGATDRVMFPYGVVLASLGEDGHLASTLEPGLFAELARGKMSILWDKDEGGVPELWLGLLPGHTQHLPASCRAAHTIVSVARSAANVAYSAVVVGVVSPLSNFLGFVGAVLLVIFRAHPVGLTVLSIWLGVVALYWRKESQKRSEREAFRFDVDLTVGAAMEILKQQQKEEQPPLRCLALRDTLREQLDGELRGGQFNRRVWPEVQSILEADHRVALRFVRGDQSFLWVGPTQ